MTRAAINVFVTIIGGLIVSFAFVGVTIGSLAVDLFHWFRARRSNELQEDVVQVIDKIFEKNIYNSQETGFIRARRWTIPLTPEQITEMNKVLYDTSK